MPCHGFSVLSIDEDVVMKLRVVHAPIEASKAARVCPYKLGDEFIIERLDTPSGLEPLAWRFSERVRSLWPPSYRFRVPRRSWQVSVARRADLGEVKLGKQEYVLQIPSLPDERTQENAELDVADAKTAISYAVRFNNSMEQAAAQGDPVPRVRIAAPVACEVLISAHPAMIPMGSTCTLTPYVAPDVQKFVFDGSEDFVEVPQAFFHFAAFASGGKELLCDLQGTFEEESEVLILDPCVLKAELPSVAELVGGARAAVGPSGAPAAVTRPTPALFEKFHSRCSQMCRTFDPQRKSAQNKAGMCGYTVCGF